MYMYVDFDTYYKIKEIYTEDITGSIRNNDILHV